MTTKEKYAELLYNLLRDYREEGDDVLVQELLKLLHEYGEDCETEYIGGDCTDAEYQDAYNRHWVKCYG